MTDYLGICDRQLHAHFDGLCDMSLQIFFIATKCYRIEISTQALQESFTLASKYNLMKVSSLAGVSAIILLLDWFYVLYITSHGLEIKAQALSIGSLTFSLPLEWLPVLGILLVSLVGWFDISGQIFPRRAGPEGDPLARVCLLRAITFSVMVFVCVLYIPYLFGSGWFWAGISRFTSFHSFGLYFLRTQESLMAFNPLWKYSASQVLAAGAMIFTAWIFGRVVRRPRKLR